MCEVTKMERSAFGGLLTTVTAALVFLMPVNAAADGSIPPYAAPCDTAEVLSLIGDKGLMQRAPQHAVALISGRILTCRQLIAAYENGFPPPPPDIVKLVPPTPYPALAPKYAQPPADCAPRAVTTSTDPMKLYAILGQCAAYVKAIPTPGASPTPPPIGYKMSPPVLGVPTTKVIYALALATDAPTSAQLSLRLANELKAHVLADGTAIDPFTTAFVTYKVVAQPTWTLTQYAQQCFNDPSTAGAIVVLPPGTQSAVANALLLSWSWTTLDLQALVVNCEPTNLTFTNNAAFVTAVTNVRSRKGTRYGVPIASLLAVVSGITALRPVHQTGTTTTYAVAPPSASPAPGVETKTGETKADSTTTNQNGNALIVASSALGQVASTVVGQVGATDAQTAAAAKSAIPEIVAELIDPCPKKKLNVSDYFTVAAQCFWLVPRT
jgi:hypothetical protein